MKNKIVNIINRKALVLCSGLLAATLGFFSCTDRLDIDPKSSFSASTYFQSVSEANTFVIGIYGQLANQNLYGSNFMPIVGDNDESHFGNRTSEDGLISQYMETPAHSYLAIYLNTLYTGVQRANLAIERIPQMDLYNKGTETQKATLRRYYGEALALRAVFYFDLVRLFGDVPFVTKYASLDENNLLPRTSRDTIYDHLVADMDTAIKYLPWQSTLSNYEVERISKNAAYGLSARICLSAAGYSLRWDLNTGSGPCTMALRADSVTKVPKLYSKARDLCKSVMDKGYNTLNTSYAQVFKNYCQSLYYPQESMFEIGFYYSTATTSYGGRIATANCFQIDGNSKYKAGNNYLKCLATYYYSFDSNDSRKACAGTLDRILNTSYRQCQNLGQLGIAKWRRDWCTVGSQYDNNTSDVNWIMLRYSDILLMFAEAEAKVNGGVPTTDAINAYEMVRKRAFGVAPFGTKSASLIGTTPTDATGFFNAIIQERSWELGHEGWRKQDLTRWNLLASKISQTKSDLLLFATRQGKYALQPTQMAYIYNPAMDTIAYYPTGTSDYAAVPATPVGMVGNKVNWVLDVNPNYGKANVAAPTNITQLTTSQWYTFAQGFVHNKSEILPLPQTILDSDPALSQCPAWK